MTVQDFPTKLPELDLVELDDQITHELTLEENYDVATGLNIFKVDLQFEEHEAQYAEIRKEIIGESEDEEEGTAGDVEGGADEEEEEEDEEKKGICASCAMTRAVTCLLGCPLALFVGWLFVMYCTLVDFPFLFCCFWWLCRNLGDR